MSVNSRLYFKSVKKYLIDKNIVFIVFKLAMKILSCYQDINNKSKLAAQNLAKHQSKLETAQFIIKTNANEFNETLNIFQ